MTTIANLIDHTLLKPDATREQIQKLCSEAKTYHFAAVCVNPYWVKLAAQELAGTDIEVCTVIGFPLGADATASKAFAAKQAVSDGATELDMVLNLGALKSNEPDRVREDIQSVRSAVPDSLLKVILEIGLLSDFEIERACQIAKEAGADFVKTSTGFLAGGATVDAVKLMRKAVGQGLGVKASGGIRDYQTALEMIEAGANRLGTSSGVAIIQEEKSG
jgi:deoxyribose-phosphate aldolase